MTRVMLEQSQVSFHDKEDLMQATRFLHNNGETNTFIVKKNISPIRMYFSQNVTLLILIIIVIVLKSYIAHISTKQGTCTQGAEYIQIFRKTGLQ